MSKLEGVQSFINYQDAHGYSPIHLAVLKGNPTVPKQLITARCNVDPQKKGGVTPFHTVVH
jgi:ankyrin repeat protein